MRVFVAGASGAIGRPLVPRLVAAGHEVTGTTRSERSAEAIRAAGATRRSWTRSTPPRCARRSSEPRPRSIVHELTALPERFDPRKRDLYDATNRIRREGTRNLLDAARRRSAALGLPEHRVRLRADGGARGHGRGGAAQPGRAAAVLARGCA